MGDHSKNNRERRQMVPNKSISLSHLALIVILVIILNAFLTYASPLEPYKRGRSASSSLIPFPRVGRSAGSVDPLQRVDSEDINDDMLPQRSSRAASNSQFYGQKRTDRVKRSLSSLLPADHTDFKTLPYPRIGKRRFYFNNQYKREPTGMIPMARIGKRGNGPPSWLWDAQFEQLQPGSSQFFDREFRSGPIMTRVGRNNDNMIPVARIGKRGDQDQTEDNYYKSIPMPRIG